MIVLEMKCPQLSKPEATAARNQNSISDRMEKKPWEKTRLSRGASSPPARRISSLFQLQQSQIVMTPLVPGSFPDGCLGDEVLTGDLSLGLISEVLGGVVIVSSQVFGHLYLLGGGSRMKLV